jgi:hypothetical protein
MSTTRSTEPQEQEAKNRTSSKRRVFTLARTGLSFAELKNPNQTTIATLLEPGRLEADMIDAKLDSLGKIQDVAGDWTSQGSDEKICFLEVLFNYNQQSNEILIEDVIKLYPGFWDYYDYSSEDEEFRQECNAGFVNPFYEAREKFRIERDALFLGLNNPRENDLASRPLKFFSKHSMYDKNLVKHIISFLEPKKLSSMSGPK